ncbi:MAG: DNA polymerase III subunit delta [Bacteroidales bacterium]|nr:DNA polymerase III subunit delta [Bacteroidales bacterium]
MAKSSVNIDAQCSKILSEVQAGRFSPVYLLMGDEPYYPEMVCNAILEQCIPEEEKDFNETVCYGSEVTAAQVITAARRFPMMAERQLVVVKEAQQMKGIEDLAIYCGEPLDSTVLVILMHKASADKRKAFYKAAAKVGTVVDSPVLRDYQIPEWILSYYASRGLQIEPQAAALLGESAGTDLSTLVVETDKLTKSLPEGTTRVTVADIERNVGISRQFSIFELTKELSYRNAAKALSIASHLGNSAKFAMPMAVSALFTHFSRILKYGALLARGGYPSPEDKARALAGVNPYFYKEYDTAVRNYPVRKAMAAVSLLCEYDYLGKGGDGSTLVSDGDLLVELTAKLLNL